MAKSYSVILGVSPSATADEIKSAYRGLAKEFHPDHYIGGNETFREIQEAYLFWEMSEDDRNTKGRFQRNR